MKRLKDQRGVAMVTVLFVAASLTVVSSTAAFVTIRDFRSGADERRAAEALAFAESGVDRVILEIKRGLYGWGRLNRAGCADPPIAVPIGELGTNRFYTAYLTVYDPQLAPDLRAPELGTWDEPGDPWTPISTGEEVCTKHSAAIPGGAREGQQQYFAIYGRGEHPTASRVVREVIGIDGKGLPVGLWAESVNVQGGNPGAIQISLITPGEVDGREKLEFEGIDPYYKLGHFWTGASLSTAVPAAAHALGSIKCQQNCPGGLEHNVGQPLNCRVNGGAQSMWDQTGDGASLGGFAECTQWSGSPTGPPPYSDFKPEDYERSNPARLTEDDFALLKDAALRKGLYCSSPGGNLNCQTPTQTFTSNGNIQSIPAGVSRDFVAYFDFPSSGGDPFSDAHTVTWKAAVGPCHSDPAVRRSVIIVARYGSVDLSGNGTILGAFFATEGQVWMRGEGGSFKVHGTVIAKKIDIGGNGEAFLDQCWLDNMNSVFLNIHPHSWSEVDR